MTLSKKIATFILNHVLAIFIANLVVGVLSLILKLSLVTVQGPTMVSRISEVVVYYTIFSITSFFLFRRMSKNPQIKLKDILLFAGLIVVVHFLIVFLAEWNIVWLVTTGSFQLGQIMYTGGFGLIESLREIPRLYYFIPLVIEDILFGVFSVTGYFKGSRK